MKGVTVRYIPNGDKVLLEKWEPDRTTSGGILIPKGSEKEIGYGRVVAVGPGTPELPMSVKVGDKVIFGIKYGCLPVDNFLIVNHQSVIAVCIEDGTDHKTVLLMPPAKQIVSRLN
jgi:chaperonin GroES